MTPLERPAHTIRAYRNHLSLAGTDATIQGVEMTPGGGIPGEDPAHNCAAGLTGPARRDSTPADQDHPPAQHPGIVPVQQHIPGPDPDGHPAARLRAGEDTQDAAGTPGGRTQCPEFSCQPPAPDYTILKKTRSDGPAANRHMAYFYSLLFTAHPELRAMFPLAMDEQRKALSAALARCAWSMDNPQSLHEYLAGLGRITGSTASRNGTTRSSARRWRTRCACSTARPGTRKRWPPGTRRSATSAR